MTAMLLLVEAGGEAHSFSWPAVLLGIVLLAANGFFVAAEISLLAARRARIEERADGGDPRAKQALKALQELSITFSGAQLGITMASLGLGAVAEPAVAALFERWLGGVGLPEGVTSGLAFGIGLSIVVFLHMVVGEMAPKNLALAHPEDVSLRLAWPFRAFVRLLRPLIVLLNGTANLVVRLAGIEPIDEVGLVHTPDELQLALRESHRHGQVSPQDARVLSAVLNLKDTDAEAAMTPRVDLLALPDTAHPQQLLEVAARTGHTRFPVYHTDIDDIVGQANVKDVLIRDDHELDGLTLADLLRPIAAVPEVRDLERLLADMRLDRSHAVLVIDEFGGTAGVLTMEDVLEELVGDIADEFDVGPVAFRRRGRSWMIDGTLRLDELERLTGFVLPAGEAETVSGHLTERLGRLLERGDTVEVGGWRFVVRTMAGRRAGRIEVIPPEEGLGDQTTSVGAD